MSTMALGQTSAWHESARGKDRENEELRFGSLWGVVTFSGIQAMLHDYRMYLENMYSTSTSQRHVSGFGEIKVG